MSAFRIARSLFYYWKPRYDPYHLTRLENRSSRPVRVRQRRWTAAQVEAVRQARERYPRWGKAKLAILLARQGIRLAVSTIGRILAHLKQRGVLVAPWRVRATPHARHPRPHAQRKPKGVSLATQTPGDLVQIDTMQLHPAPGVTRYQFTAVDCASRWSVLGVRATATAGTAKDFLGELQERMPFPIKALQIDGGSEWMAAFEHECQARHLPLRVLPPHRPQLNGQVERANRTHREEFWQCDDGDLDLPAVQPAVQAWEDVYNGVRPHHALALRTPTEFLADWQAAQLSKRS